MSPPCLVGTSLKDSVTSILTDSPRYLLECGKNLISCFWMEGSSRKTVRILEALK